MKEKRVFRVKVAMEAKYEIELDNAVWGDDDHKDSWGRVFYSYDDIDEIAESLAIIEASVGTYGRHVEGYGYILRDGEPHYMYKDESEKSVSINPIIEEEYYIEEIKEVIENEEY